MRRLLLLAVLLVGTLPVAALPAAGAAGDGLSVSPAAVEADLPSRAVSVPVHVANSGTRTETIDLSLAALAHRPDGTPLFGDPPSAVQVTPPALTLRPGEQAEVRVHGDLPADGAGLYAALLVEPRAEVTGGVGVAARTRMAVLLLLRGPAPWRQAVDVAGIGLSPDQVRVDVRNTGNVHAQPEGEAVVRAADGSVVGTVALPDERVLPEATRRLAATWDGPGNAPGPFTVEVRLARPDASATATVSLQPPAASPSPTAAASGAEVGAPAHRLPAAAIAAALLAAVLAGLVVVLQRELGRA